MRRACAASILWVAVFWIGIAAASVYTTDAVNLRNTPFVDSTTLIRTLAPGSKLTVLAEQRVSGAVWYQVTDGTETGWVRSDLVGSKPQEAVTSWGEGDAEEYEGVTNTAANLRSNPGEGLFTLIRTLREGTAVSVVGEATVKEQRWLRVTEGYDEGWIRADLVRRVEEELAEEGVPATVNVASEVPLVEEPLGAEAPPPPDTVGAAPLGGSVPDAELFAPVVADAPQPPAPREPDVPVAAAPRSGPRLEVPSVEDVLSSSGLVPSGVEAAVTVQAPELPRPASPWPWRLFRDSQVILAALVIAFVLTRLENRLEKQLKPDVHQERVRAETLHVQHALANPGVQREYDRLLAALFAVDQLLLPKGNVKSALSQLTELVAAVNTTSDPRERWDTIVSLRKRMIEVGMLPAFSRAFDGLPGYVFTDELRHKLHRFLVAEEDGLAEQFDEIREATKLCFDDLSRRLIPDILQGGALTYLYSRRLEVLEAARNAARGAASRGWAPRDLEALRQVLVHELFAVKSAA